MTLAGNVYALAQRVAAEFQTVRSEIVAVDYNAVGTINRFWTGSAWPARDTPVGFIGPCMWWSNWDPAAPQPPGGLEGDIWFGMEA